MTIQVTPIPKLTSFVIPSVTIGASAAEGAANTSIRSDSTIAGIALVGTTVNDSIVRFDGTAGQVQGYSSLSPTISDAGILSLTSGALKFPATEIASADANTLDDYQQGTFTPTVTFGGNSVGVGYNTNLGQYTKIGNVVVATGTIILTSKGSSTGNAFLGGLPYAANTAYPMGGGTGRYDQISFVGWISGTVYGATVQLIERTTSGTPSAITNADFADTAEIYWSCIYNIF